LGKLLGLEDEFQEGDTAMEQVSICNTKRTASRRCQEHLDRSVFCIFLRARKEWFYTVGTVLGMKEDQKSGKDMLTIYSPQLGKEKKVLLCSSAEADKLELYKDLNEDDELLLPQTWRFAGKGACDLLWRDPKSEEPEGPGEKQRHTQKLKIFSCIPVVIIPTNTVPIDFAMFIVSPFHKKFKQVNQSIPKKAAEGFEWREDEEEEDMEVAYNADRPS